MRTVHKFALVLGLATACGQTEECKKLEASYLEHQQALNGFKTRSLTLSRIKERAHKAERAAKETMKRFGLDKPESDVQLALTENAQRLFKKKVVRSTREAEKPRTGRPSTRTVWELTVPAKSAADALKKFLKWTEGAPLVRLETIVPRAEGYFLVAGRAVVDQVPIDPKPYNFELPTDPASIPSEFGFCNAEDTRAQLVGMRAEMNALMEDSKEISTYAPASASWLGLKMRSKHLQKVEGEVRTLSQAWVDATQAAGAKLKGLGTVDDVVIAEIVGNTAVRAKVEAKLPKHVLQSIQRMDTDDKNLIRLGVPAPSRIGSGDK